MLLPQRWMVERTFAWLKRYRRLTVDREGSTVSCVVMIRLAIIQVMLHRLCCTQPDPAFNYRVAA